MTDAFQAIFMVLFHLSTVFLGNTLLQYLEFVGILLGAVLLGKLMAWTSRNILSRIAAKTETKADDVLLGLFDGPIIFSIFLLAFYFGRSILALSDSMAALFDKLLVILIVVNATWYLTRFITSVIVHYLEPMSAKTQTDLDDHLLPVLKKIINVVVVLIAAIIVFDKLGYNISSLVAGLGIGGLAFALAAQDLLGNLFGGIAIFADKPFKIGDTVKAGDVEGTVREIGLRTTRIETYGGTYVVVPNRKIVDNNLENISRESARRVVMTLGLEYDTSAKKLEEAKRIVAANVKKTKGLRDKCDITLNLFGAYSLDLRFVFWVEKKSLDDQFLIRDALLLGIKKDFEKAKIRFAYPTQTLVVKK